MEVTGQFCELLLVRHAHVSHNDHGNATRLCGWHDPWLSVLGRRQAELLGRLFSVDCRAVALYSSPLRRAVQTAASIAEVVGLAPKPLDGLREINCGTLDGALLHEVARRHPGLWRRNLCQADDDFRWPGVRPIATSGHECRKQLVASRQGI
jgi:broad specificity phosphatase PhoE